MRRYETVVVIGAELGESKIKDELTKIEGFLSAQGAQEIKLDRWGSKEIGFRMHRAILGQYACFSYQSENSELQDKLNNSLRITDSVVKFQSFRINEKTRKFKGYVRKNAAGVADGDELGDSDSAGY